MKTFVTAMVTLALIGAVVPSVQANPFNEKRGRSVITTNPDKLEMILLPGKLRVRLVNIEPVRNYGQVVWTYGDECVLPQGINVSVVGTDRRFVYFRFFDWNNHPDASCPRRAEFMMSRKEFRRMMRYRSDKPRKLRNAYPPRGMSEKTMKRLVRRMYKREWLRNWDIPKKRRKK